VIHVEVHPEEIPDKWVEDSRELTEKLRQCVDDVNGACTAAQKRRAIIEAHEGHWKSLKETLSGWAFGKCWYSELRDSGSDYHVDHYRPKGRVRNEGEKEREGYWWLAFEWTNFRMAVSWVNSPHKDPGKASQGKFDQFPLKPGTSPIGPDESIESEIPVLLDPTNANDVLLVDFDERGLPIPTVTGWGAHRVLETSRILHLDSTRMIEARQLAWRQCEGLLKRANVAMNTPVAEHTIFHNKTAEDWVREICKMLEPRAELSAVARACVSKSPHVWARKLPSR
jgi:hypothetical protein